MYNSLESNTNKQTNTRAEAASAASEHIVPGEAVSDGRQHDPRDVGGGLHARLRAQRVHGAQAHLG